MISLETERMVQSGCRAACELLGLSQAYFAQVLGRRRHYLAGYGQPILERPRQMVLSDRVVLFWQGRTDPYTRDVLAANLKPLADTVEKELAHE